MLLRFSAQVHRTAFHPVIFREDITLKNLFKLALIIAAVALFAHFWATPPERLLEARQQPADDAPEADSFMSESITRRFDEHGTLTYLLTAQRTDFYMDSNRYQLQQPEMEMVADDNSRHRARSQLGTVFSGGEEILLESDVVIWQEEPATRAYQLRTSSLQLYPDRRFAETAQPVTLLSGQSVTDGVGLNAYLNEQRFEILANVKSVHQSL